MIVTCPRCPKTWTGTTASHCPTCHETFSVDRNGDKHRKGEGAARRCVDPASVGLVLNSRGQWSMPGPDKPIDYAAPPVQSPMSRRRDLNTEAVGNAGSCTPEDPVAG